MRPRRPGVAWHRDLRSDQPHRHPLPAVVCRQAALVKKRVSRNPGLDRREARRRWRLRGPAVELHRQVLLLAADRPEAHQLWKLQEPGVEVKLPRPVVLRQAPLEGLLLARCSALELLVARALELPSAPVLAVAICWGAICPVAQAMNRSRVERALGSQGVGPLADCQVPVHKDLRKTHLRVLQRFPQWS